MKWFGPILIITGILILLISGCVPVTYDYELCNTIDCAPSVDIEIENATE